MAIGNYTKTPPKGYGVRNYRNYGRTYQFRTLKNWRRPEGRSLRWFRRPSKAVVDLFGDDSSRQFRPKELTEVQRGTDYVVSNNRYVTTYVTYPSKTRIGTSNRTTSFIRVNGLKMSGTVSVRSTGMETDVDSVHVPFGLMSIVVVRDKKPKLYSGAQPLMPFVELFGSVESCKGTLKVADQHRDRFILLRQTSFMVTGLHGTAMKRFNVSNCIPSSYNTWVTFKDEDENNCTGQYSNTARNALLVYYVWLSDVPSHAEVYSNLTLNYVG
ncbi:nuclear shuttle protein [Bitter gourd yellow mosaic virus]|uniref:Nuclear shuttle protein n=1 Tax=Bitter gourd yellow mosaic virus TaxID=2486070 RepID=A0A5P1MAV6_9GEMI|nr:nuclear shuttle protein [Bitter gourd yellow mosaic virus]QDQ17822.1 nuclear shuttle protein [Bitter gourd yellow mosaic virus]